MHGNETTVVGQRTRNGTEDVEVPAMDADYNRHMGGIDVADQHMCY